MNLDSIQSVTVDTAPWRERLRKGKWKVTVTLTSGAILKMWTPDRALADRLGTWYVTGCPLNDDEAPVLPDGRLVTTGLPA